MTKRLGEALAATLMWLAFTAMALPVILLAFPFWIVRYAVTGKPEHREAVKSHGKALDQLINSAVFGGNPKETLSSHAGRWLTEAPERAPWWVTVVDRLTGIAEHDHVIKAIEAPFVGSPLK